jgi:hypothetical protein
MGTFLRRRLAAAILLLGTLSSPAPAQNAPPKQVPAGTTAVIGPTTGSPAVKPKTPQGKMLNTALSPETRQTLQDAMNSAK